ncbi:unnamed protein product, partial [Trichogramma brassicae]
MRRERHLSDYSGELLLMSLCERHLCPSSPIDTRASCRDTPSCLVFNTWPYGRKSFLADASQWVALDFIVSRTFSPTPRTAILVRSLGP